VSGVAEVVVKYAKVACLALLAAGLAGCGSFSADAAAQPASPATSAAPISTTTPAAAQPAGEFAGTTFWGPWAPANNPKDLGKKVVADLLPRDFAQTNYLSRGGMSYPETCTAYGCLRFVGELKDRALLDKLTKRYEIFFTTDGKRYVPAANNVDNSVFGIVPMEIYRQNGEKAADKRWLDLGKASADTEWANPRADGLSPFTRFWVDDMFMITALQAEAYRVTKDKTYMDRAAKEMVAYIAQLQKPNGLYYHGTDSPFYWGRGNGWMAAGSAELLSILPADHPDRAKILEGYKKMMAGLVKYQGKDGMWRQLIDVDVPANWSETSGTGMFVFGMAMGVRNGWLDEATYKEPVKKAWTALSGYLNADGKVREVCAGTNKSNSQDFYLQRPRLVGDFHGQAGFIWAAWAMMMEPPKKATP
jgi:unsaturated rhamnogalacturonyl hydrolase